jgi:hypothetical protein
MTVAELIAKLQTHDPAARAVVAGLHFGYDDIAAVAAVAIAPAPDAEDWDGAYADAAGGAPAVYLCSTDVKITEPMELEALLSKIPPSGER